MDRMTELELFVTTAELGTLSKAAEQLNISNASASRHLGALESRLNVKLIERNTRRLSLTSAGSEFYKRCKALLAELNEAEASLTSSQAEPAGTLTVTASVSFAMLHISPLLPKFCKRYPQLRVKVVGANRYYEIMDTDIDLAIRTREFEPDSNITIRRLAETRRILAASPDYLHQRGSPKQVQDLADHDMLLYSHANQPGILNFRQGTTEASITVVPKMETNDGQIVRAAALAGLGILVQPMYIIYDDIVSGRLVSVLDDWRLPSLTINIAFQSRRYMPAKTRLFIDFLLEEFEAQQYEKYWTR